MAGDGIMYVLCGVLHPVPGPLTLGILQQKNAQMEVKAYYSASQA
jgi:hypothetical protein